MDKVAQNLFAQGITEDAIKQFEDMLRKNNVQPAKITEMVNTLKTTLPPKTNTTTPPAPNAPSVPNTTGAPPNTTKQVGQTGTVEVESPATIEKVIKPVSAMRVSADVGYDMTPYDNINKAVLDNDIDGTEYKISFTNGSYGSIVKSGENWLGRFENPHADFPEAKEKGIYYDFDDRSSDTTQAYFRGGRIKTLRKIVPKVGSMRVVADDYEKMHDMLTTVSEHYNLELGHQTSSYRPYWVLRSTGDSGSATGYPEDIKNAKIELEESGIFKKISESEDGLKIYVHGNLRVQADVDADLEPYEGDETWQYEGDDNDDEFDETGGGPEHDLDFDFVRELGEHMGVDWDNVDFTPEDLLVGMEIEWEHGLDNPETNITDDDLEDTAAIALAHLNETGNYYSEDVGLPKMEEELKAVEE